jgi:hypothetical protein
MKTQFFVVVALLILCGCASKVPTWSKADAKARESGEFIIDDAYLESQQFTNDIMEDVETVMRLKKQLGHETVQPTRDKLNASMRAQQLETATNAAQQQAAWEAQVYIGSPNVVAKVTTMINQMNEKGQIIEQQVLTYYDNGKMRYATNFFDTVK